MRRAMRPRIRRVRAATLLAGAVILSSLGGPARAAVREVDSMPDFAQLGAAVAGSPSERRTHEQRLLDLVSRGEDAEALGYVDSLAARQPALATTLHEALAGAYVRDRRLYRAAQHLEAIPVARRSDQALYLVGHVAARQQRLEAASQAFERLARKLPDDALVARDEAQVAALLAQPGRASAACERLLRQRPGDVEATLLLARVRLPQGRVADAERLLSELLAREPRNGRAALQLGLVQLALGKPQAARKTLAKARALEPGSPGPHVSAAAVELLLGDPAAARAAVSGALKLNPADPLAALVDLLSHEGRWASATPGDSRFLAAGLYPDLETEPLADSIRAELAADGARARIAVANLLIGQLSPHAALHWLAAESRQGDWPLLEMAAVQAAMESADLQAAEGRLAALSKHQAAHGLIGPEVQSAMLAARRNDPGGARAALDRAVALAPQSPRLRMLAGDLHLALGEPALAVPEYRQALARWPRDPRLLNQLAHALAQVGTRQQHEEALAYTETALKQQPHYLLRAALLDTRADLLFRLGRRAEALKAYRELSTTVGGITTPEQWHRLAELAREAGDAKLARKAYEEALDYGRQYPGRKEAVRQLAASPAARP